MEAAECIYNSVATAPSSLLRLPQPAVVVQHVLRVAIGLGEATAHHGIYPDAPDPGRHDTVPATGHGVGRGD